MNRYTSKCFVISVWFILLIATNVAKAQNDINFTSLTVKEGLSSNTVNAVIKDTYGLMWFGTTNGLSKFDGTNFKFNALFDNGNRICVPEGQLLSTEHRIFALIRMGIHDNDRIARLLSYSVNTIYSYKNRIKNKSFIANEEFEHYVMDIEAV